MPNIEITNVVTGSGLIDGRAYRTELLTFAGAGTVKENTILARDSVSGKLVVFEKGGSTNENGIPKNVVPYEVTATGAGDVSVRVVTDGIFREDRLVIDADGDNTNVDAVVIDQLQDFNIAVEAVTNKSVLDNQ